MYLTPYPVEVSVLLHFLLASFARGNIQGSNALDNTPYAPPHRTNLSPSCMRHLPA